jgi:hypothetical protein
MCQRGKLMGLRSWWRANRERAAATRRSLQINNDHELIAQQVPELAGMTVVEGMADVLQQIQEWNRSCSPGQACRTRSATACVERGMEG